MNAPEPERPAYLFEAAYTEGQGQASEAYKLLGEELAKKLAALPQGDYLFHFSIQVEHQATTTTITPMIALEPITIVNSLRVAKLSN